MLLYFVYVYIGCVRFGTCNVCKPVFPEVSRATGATSSNGCTVRIRTWLAFVCTFSHYPLLLETLSQAFVLLIFDKQQG